MVTKEETTKILQTVWKALEKEFNTRRLLLKGDTCQWTHNYFGDNSEGIIRAEGRHDEAIHCMYMSRDVMIELARNLLKEIE